MAHIFSGSCDPNGPNVMTTFKTFSVGIYEIIPTKSGKIKKGKVKVRVKGKINQAESVYQKAKEIIKLLDEGKYTGSKNIVIK